MSRHSDFTPRPWVPTAEYYIAGGIDIRDVIEAFGLNFNRGAVVKYMARAGRKPDNPELLDLYKAREHINREIARLRGAASHLAPVPVGADAEWRCPRHPSGLRYLSHDGELSCALPRCDWRKRLADVGVGPAGNGRAAVPEFMRDERRARSSE